MLSPDGRWLAYVSSQGGEHGVYVRSFPQPGPDLQVSDQYTTDSEKALLYLEGEGFEEIILMGATGWRLALPPFTAYLLDTWYGGIRGLIGGH